MAVRTAALVLVVLTVAASLGMSLSAAQAREPGPRERAAAPAPRPSGTWAVSAPAGVVANAGWATNDDYATTNRRQPVAIDVLANDAQWDYMGVNAAWGEWGGQLTCDGSGGCTFTPDPGFTGWAAAKYQVWVADWDYYYCSCWLYYYDTGTVSIDVRNAAPIGVADKVGAWRHTTSVGLNVLAND